MEFRPVDLSELIGIVMGTSIVLLPVLAFTFRFALKPLVEALGKAWGAKEDHDRIAILEKRVVLLERQLVSNELEAMGTGFSSARLGARAD